MKEIAALFNGFIVFGAFVFEHETGSVNFRDAQSVNESNAVADIEQLLNRAAFPLSLWQCAFSCVELQKSTPEAAVRLALLLSECDDEAASISGHQSGKLMMAVQKGGGSTSQAISAKTPLALI